MLLAIEHFSEREELCRKKVGPADPEDAANLAVLAGPDGTMATRTKGTCTWIITAASNGSSRRNDTRSPLVRRALTKD
jgi:hypothetical protein